jgi:hypothetical protein
MISVINFFVGVFQKNIGFFEIALTEYILVIYLLVPLVFLYYLMKLLPLPFSTVMRCQRIHSAIIFLIIIILGVGLCIEVVALMYQRMIHLL